MSSKEYNHIKLQSEAVLHFFQELDIDMLDAILDSNRTYQDFKKEVFIAKPTQSFNEFMDAGDTCLEMYPGHCNSKSCNFNSKGIRFIGNHSKNFMDLIIDIQNGAVKDIYECSFFKCMVDFELLNNRIEIDKFIFPFEMNE
jgi:hypothetical protein